MSIDGLLTFFGFLAAGFALLDQVSKLRLLLHVKRQLFLFLVAFSSIGFLILPEAPSNSIPSFYPSTIADFVVWVDASAIGAGGTAFLILILWAFLAIALYKSATPTASSLKKLNILAERLITQRRYLELVDVVKPYVPLVSKASRRQLFFQRLHDWIKGGGPFALSISEWMQIEDRDAAGFERAKRAVSHWLRRAGRIVFSPLAFLVPAQRQVSQTATDLEVSLLRTVGLRDFLVSSRADFIVDLMELERFSTEEFVTDIVSRMMSTSDSHFFREVKLMDVRNGRGGFVYEEQLCLMRRFVLDSEFACRHGIWKPFGDTAINLIRENTEYRERLLQAPPDDALLYGDPVYCTVQFFQAMVDTAARGSVEDNMWLMYMSIVSKELVDLHTSWTISNPEGEFPTLAMRLIYEITHTQRNWIELYKKLADDNYHTSDEAVGGWDTASIVMWSVRDHAKTTRYIVNSSHLPERFQIDRWSAYVRLISEIPDDGKFSFIRSSLAREAINPHDYSMLGDLSAELAAIHAKVDPVLRLQANDLSSALNGAS